jgi:transcriptional regulator with XRE-family HTH domain
VTNDYICNKELKMEKFIINKLLKERGLSFQQLADELHIHRTNLYTSLAGNPTLIRLVDIANILKVDGTDLFSKNKQAK